MILCIKRAESVERKTEEEKRVDKNYLEKFKGVKEIKECIVSCLLSYFLANRQPINMDINIHYKHTFFRF